MVSEWGRFLRGHLFLFWHEVILHAEALTTQCGKKLFEFSIKMLLPRKGAQTLKCTAAETVNMLVFPRMVDSQSGA